MLRVSTCQLPRGRAGREADSGPLAPRTSISLSRDARGEPPARRREPVSEQYTDRGQAASTGYESHGEVSAAPVDDAFALAVQMMAEDRVPRFQIPRGASR